MWCAPSQRNCGSEYFAITIIIIIPADKTRHPNEQGREGRLKLENKKRNQLPDELNRAIRSK